MNVLSIFLIIVVLACLFSPTKQTESFITSNCRTLRCENNKYSATSLKNTATNHLASLASNHIDTVKNHFSNLKEQWL